MKLAAVSREEGDRIALAVRGLLEAVRDLVDEPVVPESSSAGDAMYRRAVEDRP